MYEILTEKTYEKFTMPEKAKQYRAWYNIAKCKCECGRVVNLKGIRQHEKTAPHKIYLEKKAC